MAWFSLGIKRSGDKATVKRPAPQSPANIRQVDSGKGSDRRHTHVKVPKTVVKNTSGGQ